MNNIASKVWPSGVKPNIGDLATSESVGRKGRAIHIWEACPTCGDERWVKRNARGTNCQSCSTPPVHYGPDNPRWNPTRKTKTRSGYRIQVTAEHPFFIMAHRSGGNRFFVLEHRLVMAEMLGRPLDSWEVVHHIDGDNLNNAPENLLLLPHQAMHSAYTLLQVEIREVKARVTLLEAENALLRQQVNLLGQGNPELNGDAKSVS